MHLRKLQRKADGQSVNQSNPVFVFSCSKPQWLFSTLLTYCSPTANLYVIKHEAVKTDGSSESIFLHTKAGPRFCFSVEYMYIYIYILLFLFFFFLETSKIRGHLRILIFLLSKLEYRLNGTTIDVPM